MGILPLNSTCKHNPNTNPKKYFKYEFGKYYLHECKYIKIMNGVSGYVVRVVESQEVSVEMLNASIKNMSIKNNCI